MREQEHPPGEIGELGDLSPEAFREELHRLADWVADYRANLEKLRVAPSVKPGAVRTAFPAEPPEQTESIEKIVADVDRVILPGMLHWAHPMFLSYFGWTTTAPGILGEIITAPLNVNAMTWRTCPAATELETLVINWLRQWMRLPKEFDGVVYDTASVAVMHALAVAREEAAPFVRELGLAGRSELPRFRVYASDQAHSSAEKAAIVLGLGQQNVQRVPSDAAFRMDVASLRAMIERDVREKFKPLAAIATVGTTSTASVDPVPEVAKICRHHQMWLHIDGAYGAGFALLPEQNWVTAGWTEADSLVVNPHKMLFVPLDFSVLYVRGLERLRRVFALVPEYLRGDTVPAEKNYMDYGIQLGRRFRALKAWMVFRAFGRAGMAARIREHLRLAHLLADWIKNDDRFELAAPVVMPVVCFRWVGPGAGDGSAIRATADKIDELNSKIVERINASGRAYLTQTKLLGQTVMRIGLGNILTTEDHVRRVWEVIQETANQL